MCLAQRPQCSDAGEAQSAALCLESNTLPLSNCTPDSNKHSVNSSPNKFHFIREWKEKCVQNFRTHKIHAVLIPILSVWEGYLTISIACVLR